MKSILKITLFLFILVLITVFVIYKIPFKSKKIEFSNPKKTTTDSFISQSEEILNNLTLEQKIGQLFIIGFDGKIIAPKIENLIKEIHPGGILLLKRNIGNEEELKGLIDSLQKIALEDTGLSLFIAVDQEGGLVSRIDWIEKTPQSEIETSEQAWQIGKNRGEELKKLGINLNLAPLLDTVVAGDFIFERSFQKEPKEIKELAESIIKGQKDAEILTSIKHFPGYTGISFNPEEKLATLENVPEISQFQNLNSEMIMTSNVIYKELNENLPFTFSEKGIHFLKEKNKGDYLIISDDLDQNSLLNKFSLNEIVSLPFKAGVDILIFSGWRLPAEKGISAFKQAVEKNEISEDRINQSVLKIIELKQKNEI